LKHTNVCFPEQKYLKLKLQTETRNQQCCVWSVNQTAESQLPAADLQSKLFKPGRGRIIPSVVNYSPSRSSLLSSIAGQRNARNPRILWNRRGTAKKTDPRNPRDLHMLLACHTPDGAWGKGLRDVRTCKKICFTHVLITFISDSRKSSGRTWKEGPLTIWKKATIYGQP